MSKKPTLSTISGFSAVEASIVILVIAVLSLSGWYVWHKHRHVTPHSTNSTTQQAASQTATPKSQSNTATPTDPSEGGKYLVIKEWGVRFPLPESMRGDVTYRLDPATSLDPEIAYFQVGKIARIPGSLCTLSGDGVGIGVTLARLTTEPSAKDIQIFGSANFHHIGNYWYRATFGKATCLPSNGQLDTDTRLSLGNAIHGLAPIQ